MPEIPHEVEVALAAFAAVLAANLVKWLSQRVTDFVRGTPNKIDDKIWAAVQGAMDQALKAGKQGKLEAGLAKSKEWR